MSVIQIVLLLIVAGITGIGSVVDEAQTHRPLVACTYGLSSGISE